MEGEGNKIFLNGDKSREPTYPKNFAFPLIFSTNFEISKYHISDITLIVMTHLYLMHPVVSTLPHSLDVS